MCLAQDGRHLVLCPVAEKDLGQWGGHRRGQEDKGVFLAGARGRGGREGAEQGLGVPDGSSFPQAAEVTAMGPRRGLCTLQGKAEFGDWAFSKKTKFLFYFEMQFSSKQINTMGEQRGRLL